MSDEATETSKDGAYVTLPVGLYDQMAKVYYLWRAGHLTETQSAEAEEASVGVEPKVSDLEPAGDGGTENGEQRVLVDMHPCVPQGFTPATDEELGLIKQGDDDAARTGHPDASEKP